MQQEALAKLWPMGQQGFAQLFGGAAFGGGGQVGGAGQQAAQEAPKEAEKPKEEKVVEVKLNNKEKFV